MYKLNTTQKNHRIHRMAVVIPLICVTVSSPLMEHDTHSELIAWLCSVVLPSVRKALSKS